MRQLSWLLFHLTQALSSAAKGWVTLTCVVLSQFARVKEETANPLTAGSSLPALAVPQGAGGSLCCLDPSAAPKTSEYPSPVSQWLSQPTGTRQNFSDDSEELRKGLWLYIYYKCLRLHTFKPSAEGIMWLRFACYFAWLLSDACRSFHKQKRFFPRVLCLRNKRCIESNLPWAWGEIGDSEMLL